MARKPLIDGNRTAAYSCFGENCRKKRQNALKARPQGNMGFFTTPRPHGEEPRVTWIKEVLGCEGNEVLAFIRNRVERYATKFSGDDRV